MIDFINVSKSFKADLLKGSREFLALDSLSFSLQPGSLTGFLGANGAGKTTSLKILFKFISQSSGRVEYDKTLGRNWGEILSNIGYVPERPYFYPYLSGYEFIYFTASLNNVPHKNISGKINQWADRLGIAHALDRQIKGYSKGMLQRIGVLSCLIHEPKIIILDEPLSGLDPLGRLELKKVFSDLQRDGVTVFFSSHIVSDVEEVSDSVIVIDKGKLVYEGSVEQVLDDNSADEFIVVVRHEKELLLDHSIVKSMDANAVGSQLEVEGKNLENVLNKLMVDNCHIERVQRKRITLEEFVYQSRNEELNAPST